MEGFGDGLMVGFGAHGIQGWGFVVIVRIGVGRGFGVVVEVDPGLPFLTVITT